jgi:hypothetical protein
LAAKSGMLYRLRLEMMRPYKIKVVGITEGIVFDAI